MPKGELKSPHVVDVAVGANIRQRRRKLKISQEALAAAIGLTFQQVQKYERGANRVSASMLYDISRILRCDAGDLLPRGDWKADGVVSDWLQDARALHRQHPDLFEALKAWPESHLRLLLATRQVPQKL